MKPRMQNQNFEFLKIALNYSLIILQKCLNIVF